MIRLYRDEDFNELINIAYRHLGSDYALTVSELVNNIDSNNTVYVYEDNIGIRSFIIYKKEVCFDVLAFTDIFDRFSTETYRKFREIIVNRTNTIIIHFSKNKNVLERAIKKYGGYVVLNYIIVPKKEVINERK